MWHQSPVTGLLEDFGMRRSERNLKNKSNWYAKSGEPQIASQLKVLKLLIKNFLRVKFFIGNPPHSYWWNHQIDNPLDRNAFSSKAWNAQDALIGEIIDDQASEMRSDHLISKRENFPFHLNGFKGFRLIISTIRSVPLGSQRLWYNCDSTKVARLGGNPRFSKETY